MYIKPDTAYKVTKWNTDGSNKMELKKVNAVLLFQGNAYNDLDNDNKKTKSNESLFEMAEKKFFGDTELLSEIDKYLKSRKAQKNYPTRVSWEMQLELLKKLPKQFRASSVRRSTLNGYRQIAYEQKCVDTLNLKKADSSKISTISF